MPKIVDHDQRRAELVDALWRVVTRDGVAAITIRSVAAEAGVPPGLVSYYFPDRAALLAGAMRRHVAEAERKVARILAGPIDLERAVDLVMIGIPHTRQGRQQSGVWLLLIAERDSKESAAQLLKELDRRVLDEVESALLLFRQVGILHPERDLDIEAMRLHSLLDGLSLHSTTDPRRMTETRLRAAVRSHLGDLGRPPR